MWIFMAILSAFFGGITSILAKCGIKKTDSDIATGIRTIIILFCLFLIVLINGSINLIYYINLNDYIFFDFIWINYGVFLDILF